MDITKIQLNENNLSLGKPFILVSIDEKYQFDGKKYLETVDHYRVEVVAPANGFEKFIVKVTEKPTIPEDQYGKAFVQFNNFEAHLYHDFDSKTYKLTCKAKSVTAIAK